MTTVKVGEVTIEVADGCEIKVDGNVVTIRPHGQACVPNNFFYWPPYTYPWIHWPTGLAEVTSQGNGLKDYRCPVEYPASQQFGCMG